MDPDHQSESPSAGGRTVALAMAAFALLSLTAAITSNGFGDADAATHYLYARFALHTPVYLVNPWGRPLATFVFALGTALGGLPGARIISLLCAIGCALTAWRLAIAQHYRRPALAAIFTFGQPLLFLHSFSVMTELPFALVAGLAFLAYSRGRWGTLAVLASLLPLGRPEGFGFCLLAAAALIAHRRWVWTALLILPLLIWDYAGWAVEGRHGVWWQWLIHSWPYSSGSDYGRGAPFHFVLVLPMLVSPAALPAVWIGVARSLGARRQKLIAAIPVTVLIVHSLLHWLGKLSSNGELRYLLIAAPFWGLLAADGWEWLCERLRWRQPAAWAALALLLPAQLNWLIPIVPTAMNEQWHSARRVVTWYRNGSLRRGHPHLLFAHPAIDYFLNCAPDDPVRSMSWTRQAVIARPPGTVLIWDSEFAGRNADPARDVTIGQILSAGWKEISPGNVVLPGWRLFLSEPDQ